MRILNLIFQILASAPPSRALRLCGKYRLSAHSTLICHATLSNFSLTGFHLLAIFIILYAVSSPLGIQAQQQLPPNQTSIAAPALVRRTTRRETRRTNFGSTLVLYGAPVGNVTIEAWSRAETEITADIELRADTEDELARLAEVVNFSLDAEGSSLRINTLGTHDRKHMRRAAGKNFQKKLLTAPWRIDYTLRVPAYTDLEIYVGKGAFAVSNTEGALQLNLTEGNASLAPAGGDVRATIGRGRINLRPMGRSWRGRGIDVRLASGELTAEFPTIYNADIDARILQNGLIENTYKPFTILETSSSVSSINPATSKPLNISTTLPSRGRIGAGGAQFTFAVGTGNIRIKQQ